MKILFVAVFDEEGVSSNTSQAIGLEKLGHQVHRYNYRVRGNEIGTLHRDTEIVAVCKRESPDLVVFAKCNTVDTRVLIECKKLCTVCYWFPDPLVTYSEPEYYEKTKYADYFCCDKQNVLEKARKFNDNCHLIFDGYDSDLEYPKNLDQDIDVSFIGNYYGDRKEKIDHLSHDVEVVSDAYGSRHSEVVSRSTINLNFCTALGASDRIYKILGARGFLLSDDWIDREKYFEDGKHLVIYKDLDDLNEKIDYYLNNKEERDRIREAGYQEIQKHTRLAWGGKVVEIYDSLPKKEKVFIAGPWVGEFGWELFAWQAYLRAMVPSYDKVICIARKNSQAIYEDFCDEFVEYNPSGGLADSFFMHDVKIDGALFFSLMKDKLNLAEIRPTWFPPRRIGTPPHTHFSEKFNINNLTLAPEYVIFGNVNKMSKYDYVFHIRNRDLRKEDNWSMERWKELLNLLCKNGEKVACIGTAQESGWVEGTDDLRDIPLSQLFDTLRSSGYCFGSSSGPMHLAALCGCPHIVWSIDSNKERYTNTWNPHQTPVLFMSEYQWHPDAEYVFNEFAKWKEAL
tara:strand:- start:2508 stop:4211 length:1704 start_codon:yes stop_codon:yes gene_type:complete